MNVGFTGTQQGMTSNQYNRVLEILAKTPNDGTNVFRHGDCIGADSDAHDIAFSLGYYIVIHPPSNPSKRAFRFKHHFLITMVDPKPYLDRNHDIVDDSDILIACPKETEEQLRSGTWATVRYARKTGKPIHLILP